MPVRHFDHIQNIREKELYDYAMGKKKRPKQRKIPTDKKLLPDKGKGGMNQEIERRAKETPGPWSYDLKVKWMKGSGKE